jgi:hypothetical protein
MVKRQIDWFQLLDSTTMDATTIGLSRGLMGVDLRMSALIGSCLFAYGDGSILWQQGLNVAL